MHPKFWKFPNRNVQTVGFVYHDKWRKSWSSIEGPVVLLERNLYGQWQDYCGKSNLRKILLHHGWEKGFQLGICIRPPWKGFSYLCMWLTSNWVQRNKTLVRCGKYSTKKSIWEKTMFESRISAGVQRNYHFLKIFVFFHGLMTWLVMRKSVWNDIVSWQKRRLSNSTMCLLHASIHHHFKEEEMKFVGQLSQVCSQIVLKCWYLARIGRPDILWSVNKVARSITKWTKARGKRLNRLISYFKQIGYVQ